MKTFTKDVIRHLPQTQVLLIKAKPRTIALEDTNLVGNVHSLRVSRETHESLLETESCDHSVNLLALHSVELVDGITDLLLVGTEINKEGKNVLRLCIRILDALLPPQSSSSQIQ